MVHRLWSDSNVLVKNIMEMFLKKAANFDKELEQLDLSNRSGWKKVEHLDIGDVVRAALSKVSPELKEDLLCTFRSSAKAMPAYLQEKLPITNSILKRCFYLCLVTRKGVVEEDEQEVQKSSMKTGLLYLARQFQQFSTEDIEILDTEIDLYLSLPQVPVYNPSEHVDDWWVKTLNLMGEKFGDYPNILKRLVFLALSLSHGQAFVERGFNTTKWILKGNRGSLSMESFTAQKSMKDLCEKYGGAGLVPLAHSLLVDMRQANNKYHKGWRKRKSRKRLNAQDRGTRRKTWTEKEKRRKRKHSGRRNTRN